MGRVIIIILVLSIIMISIGAYIYFNQPAMISKLSFLNTFSDSIFSNAIFYSQTNSELQLRLDRYQGLEKFLITDQSWEFTNHFNNITNETTENLTITLTINKTVYNFMKNAVANPTMAKCLKAEPYIQQDRPNFNCSIANHRNILLSTLQNFTQQGLRLRKAGVLSGFTNMSNKSIVTLTIPKDSLKVNDVLEIGENSLTFTITTFSTSESIDTNVTQENNFSHLEISTTDPYDDLVLYFPFDENFTRYGNITYDYTANDNDGTAVGGVVFNTTDCLPDYGNCVGFDGSNDIVNVGSAEDTDITNNLTVSAWVRREVIDELHSVIAKDDGTNRNYQLFIQGGTGLANKAHFIVFSSGTQFTAVSNDNITANVWHNLIGVHNGTDVIIYVNGVLQTTTDSVASIDNDPTDLCIGDRCGGGVLPFNGEIDEVMIFNTSLTSSQISNIYNNQSARFKAQGLQEFKDFNVSFTNEDRVNVTAEFNRDFQSNMSLRMGQWELGLGYNDSVDGDVTPANDDGMVLYYHFDNLSSIAENDTHVFDFSGNGNNGTGVGGFLANNSGYYNGSWRFDGVDEFFSASDSASLDITSNITLSFWFKRAATGVHINIGKWESVSPLNKRSYLLQVFTDDKIYFSTSENGTGNDAFFGSTDTTTDLGWNHLVGVHNETDITVYLNAEELAGSITGSVTKLLFNSSIDFRNIYDGNENNGSIDEVMIFNRSLSVDEIKSLYIKGRLLYNFTDPLNLTASLENTTFNIANTTERFLPEFQFISGNRTANPFYSPLLRPDLIFDFFEATAAGDNPPVSILSSPADNANFTNGSIVTFEVNGTDDFNLQNVTLTVYNPDDSINHTNFTNWTGTSNSTTFSFNFSAGGLYLWNALVTDNASQTDWAVNRTLNITTVVEGDTTNPNVTINQPLNQTYATSTIDFNVTALDDTAVDSCLYTINDGLDNFTMTNIGNEWNATNATMNEGSHTATYYCNDTDNNLNDSETVTFFIDTIFPDIDIVVPTVNNSNTTNTGQDINFTVSDANLAECWYSNDTYSANRSLICGQNLTNVTWSEGNHNITVYANDTANNVNFSTISFRVDTTAPTFDNIQNFTHTQNTSFSFDLDATDTGVGVADFIINDTTFFIIDITSGLITNDTNLSRTEIHWLTATVNDTLGNTRTSGQFFINITPITAAAPASEIFSIFPSVRNEIPHIVLGRRFIFP